MSEPAFGLAPSLDDFAGLAETAFAALPEAFRKMAGEVLFRVEDFADEEVLDSLGIEDPFDLTGLYHGVDVSQRSVLGPAREWSFAAFAMKCSSISGLRDCASTSLRALMASSVSRR